MNDRKKNWKGKRFIALTVVFLFVVVQLVFMPHLTKGDQTIEQTEDLIATDSNAATDSDAYSGLSIDTIEELENQVNAAISDTVFELSPSFPEVLSDAIDLTIPLGVHITIGGNSKVLTTTGSVRHFNVTNQLDGTLTLMDLTIQGRGGVHLKGGTYEFLDFKVDTASGSANNTVITGTGAETLSIQNGLFTSGTGTMVGGISDLKVEDTTFLNTNGTAITSCKAIDVKRSVFKDGRTALDGGSLITIEESLFEGNSAGHGAAISVASNSDYTVSNSSFVRNTGTAGGYNGGAVSADQKSMVHMIFNNCYFEGNEAKQGYTGTNGGVGGHGGAISYYRTTGNLTVNQSYFKENKATGDSNTSDGGAIAIFSASGNSNIIKIENTTFEGNEARDDAGAIFVEGASATEVTAVISNNTFYRNVGLAYDDNGSGGAIQFSLNATGTVVNNTFYDNKQGDGIVRGNDVGYHAALFKTPRYIFQNNLFVGETGSPRYTNVRAGLVTNNGGNVGLDYLSAQPADLTQESIFGSDSAVLDVYGSLIQAGMPSYKSPVMTLMILPESQADSAGTTGTAVSSIDSRGKRRNAEKPDAGAVDISWVKFDAIAGKWNGLPDYTLGLNYYNGTAPTAYYKISDQAGSIAALDAANFVISDMILEGWDTDPAGTSIVYNFEDPLTASEQTVYAVYREPGFTVRFHTNGGSRVENITGVLSGSTIAEPEKPIKRGYALDGWYLDNLTFSKKWDFDTKQVTGNITLHAKWSAVYTVTFISNGGSAVAPITTTAGSTIAEPMPPKRQNYTFLGWYKDDGTYLNKWDFTNEQVCQDICLYAKWRYTGGGGTGTITPTKPVATKPAETTPAETTTIPETTTHTIGESMIAGESVGIDTEESGTIGTTPATGDMKVGFIVGLLGLIAASTAIINNNKKHKPVKKQR